MRARTPNQTRVAGLVAVLFVVLFAADRSQRARRDPAADVVARGAALYAVHCASCHGANLEGQPDWKHSLPDGSLPAPPHDTSGHTWHHGDGELLRIIGKGGTIYMPNSKMPGFAGTLSDDDMRAVLAFIKTFWGAKELSWQANVTAGEVGPGAAP